MREQLDSLKKLWSTLSSEGKAYTTKQEISSFQSENGLIIPKDIEQYFVEINGTGEEYDNDFFRFQSFAKFKSIDEELRYWGGVPDYTNIVNTLADYKNCFVFADYSIQVITYAIRLHPNKSITNDVYAICGDKYQSIANSFIEFLDLYLVDSDALYL